MSGPAGPTGDDATRPRAVVVGAGVSGLAAAWELVGHGARVTVVESSGRAGGLLRAGEVGGVVVDVGAEATLARRPEALALAAEVGLGEQRVDPAVASSTVWTSRGPRPLPAGTVMGVPAGAAAVPALAGVLSEAEVAEVRERAARSAAERAGPPAGDVSVGAAVAAQVGRPVVDMVVEPLLGGVYAGHADRLSLAATVPALWAQWRQGRSLLDAAAAVLARDRPGGSDRAGGSDRQGGSDPGGSDRQGGRVDSDGPDDATVAPTPGGPVFAGLAGGMATLATALVSRLRAAGVPVRTETTATVVRRVGEHWHVELAGRDPLVADAVVVAVPVAQAARLLVVACPVAARELAEIETASVATVALAVPADTLSGLGGSGLLVPPRTARAAGITVKAVTYSSVKWSWVGQQRAGVAVVRASLGRAGAAGAAVLDRDDADLAGLAAADVARLLDRPVPVVGSLVTRWPESLPQYAVGHLDRVARVRSALARLPGLALAGNALDGVGVPACVSVARRAAREAVGTPVASGGGGPAAGPAETAARPRA